MIFLIIRVDGIAYKIDYDFGREGVKDLGNFPSINNRYFWVKRCLGTQFLLAFSYFLYIKNKLDYPVNILEVVYLLKIVYIIYLSFLIPLPPSLRPSNKNKASFCFKGC